MNLTTKTPRARSGTESLLASGCLRHGGGKLRWTLRGVAAAVALQSIAVAQVSLTSPVAAAVRALKQAGVIEGPEQVSPLEPTGFPGLPPKTQILPPPSVDSGFRIIESGETTRQGPNVKMTGGAEFVYRGYHVFADTAEGNLDTRIFTLTGNVKVIGQDANIVGQAVTVDFEAQTYRATNAEASLKPSLVQGQLQDNLYVKGQESYGSEREIFAHEGHATTCNLEFPHYHIDAENVVVRPGVRAIFRKAKVKLFGKTILALPYLSVPLDDRTYRNLPEAGQSPEEGYYVKNRIGIPLRGGDDLFTRIDYMTKLGAGLGGDYRYRNENLSGTARLYTVTGQINTLNISNDHQQRFSWGTLTLQNTFQRNNYLVAPQSTMINTRALLNIPQGSGATRLSFNRSGNESAGFRTANQSIGLSDTRTIRSFRSNLELNWLNTESRFTTGNPVEREQVDLRFRGSQELRRATANIEYVRSIPVGDIQNFFSGSDRTPYFSLASDARRLFGEGFARNLPFRTELSLGEFVDTQTRSHIGRGTFDVTFQKPDLSSKPLQFDVNGQFRQGMYSDDTAQYVLNLGTALSYRMGDRGSANLRYHYLRPYGFSPLSIDRTGRTNLVTFDMSYRPLRTLSTGIQTGYDILRLNEGDTAWQQVGIRTEWRPNSDFLLRGLSTYDSFNQVWGNVRLDMSWRAGDTFVSLGTRYDGYRHTWSNVNLFLDNFKWGRLKFGTILHYNGFTKRFDAQQYSFIYDLHCAEAILQVLDSATGFRSGREVVFFIRLKALPFDTPFGTGRRGQPLGTGTGRDF